MFKTWSIKANWFESKILILLCSFCLRNYFLWYFLISSILIKYNNFFRISCPWSFIANWRRWKLTLIECVQKLVLNVIIHWNQNLWRILLWIYSFIHYHFLTSLSFLYQLIIQRQDYFIICIFWLLIHIFSLLKRSKSTSSNYIFLRQNASLNQKWITILFTKVKELIWKQLIKI